MTRPASLSHLQRLANCLNPTIDRLREATGFSPETHLSWAERKVAVAGIRLAHWVIAYGPRQDNGCPIDDVHSLYMALHRLAEAIQLEGTSCGAKARAFDSFAYYASILASPLGHQYIVDQGDPPPWDDAASSASVDYGDRFASCRHASNQRYRSEHGQRDFPKCSTPEEQEAQALRCKAVSERARLLRQAAALAPT